MCFAFRFFAFFTFYFCFAFRCKTLGISINFSMNSQPKPRKKKRKSRRRLGARQYKNYSAEMLELATELVKKKKLSAREAQRQFSIPKQTILNKVHQVHNEPVGCPTKLSALEQTKFVKVLIAASDFGCPLTRLDLRLIVFEYLKKIIESKFFVANHLEKLGSIIF